ncbi:MAG: T9SS type A sorting domain-containing protein [Chitinophagales bacterium]|nr:T9SS type A sorting domain-containing protein [Chitinophagales bacterium]
MKKIYFSIFLFFALLNYSKAQNCQSQRYISEIFSNTQSHTGIKFGEADPYGLINNQDLYLDIVEPAGDSLQKRPLIIHAFGGGFLIGWRTEPVIPQMSESYAKRGFVFATIDYRLGFNVADGQSAERAVYRGAQDMAAALRFLVDSADVYGIDTSAIFLTGTSAGCFSALINGFMEESDRANINSTYGIFLEPDDLGCLQCGGNNNFNNQRANVHGIINNWGAILDTSYISPATTPTDYVPTISFHGTNDLIVPYDEGPPFQLPIFPNVQGSLLIHQRLDNVGIKNRLYPLQGLGHEPELLEFQEWVTDTILKVGSEFLYEIMYGDTNVITGDNTVCINTTHTYSLPTDTSSFYCWEVVGGTIINENYNEITIEWNTVGNHILKGTQLNRRYISKEATLLIDVQEPPTPLISFTSNDGLFNFYSSTVANSYTWTIENNSYNGTPVQYQFLDTNYHQISLTVENDYCSNTKDTTFLSTLCPNADFYFEQNDSILTLVNNSEFSNSAYWISYDASVYTDSVLNLLINAEGNYSFTLIAQNSFCSDTQTLSYPFEFCSHANFDFQANNLVGNFTNQSFNAYFYNWDFGDGGTSGIENPQHTYSQPGSYIVTLITSSVSGCFDTIQQAINVDIENAIHNSYLQEISIYPNPTNNNIYINGLYEKENYTFSIFDINGKELTKNKLIASHTISVKNLSKGICLLKITDTKGNSIKKQVLIK